MATPVKVLERAAFAPERTRRRRPNSLGMRVAIMMIASNPLPTTNEKKKTRVGGVSKIIKYGELLRRL
jgi:hypothetical protein